MQLPSPYGFKLPCEHRHVFTHPVAKLCPLKTSLNQRKITLGPAATLFFWYQLRARGKVQIAHCIGASLSVAQHPARVRSFALSALRRAGRVGVGRGGASQVRCSLALVLCVGAALLGTTHVFALLVGRLGLLLLVTPLLVATEAAGFGDFGPGTGAPPQPLLGIHAARALLSGPERRP